MKTLDIALKDLYRSFRSAFILVFAFLIPMLMAGLFYFAFGGLASDDGGFEFPTTRVVVVNQDAGVTRFSAGDMFVDVLQQAIPGAILVSEASDAKAARAAVDQQQASVAVIIPASLSAAASQPGSQAAVEVYRDPTLTLGPGVVEGMVTQLVDGFAGAKIAVATVSGQLADRGIQVDTSLQESIAQQYGAWSAEQGKAYEGDANPYYTVTSPGDQEADTADTVLAMVSQIMAGVMVMFVFFTGAFSAMSILQEEEDGTLPRLFTTPTSHVTILSGKFLAIFVTLAIQIVVLLVASTLIFGFDWGEPMGIALMTIGLVVLAAGFGIFLTSFLDDTRQAGWVYGGVLTVLGMIGMVHAFTAGIPGASTAISSVSLIAPQGWGVRGWLLLLEGSPLWSVLPTLAVMLALGVLFFTIGALKFGKRYT